MTLEPRHGLNDQGLRSVVELVRVNVVACGQIAERLITANLHPGSLGFGLQRMIGALFFRHHFLRFTCRLAARHSTDMFGLPGQPDWPTSLRGLRASRSCLVQIVCLLLTLHGGWAPPAIIDRTVSP